MKKIEYKQQAEGSITVFLSLILLLILSLLLTIIEGARVSTAKVYTERALSTAMDSVLAEYYGPLWEEYHVFGYYPGEGTEQEVSKQISSLIESYMSYTLEPEKDLEAYDLKDHYDLIGIPSNSVSLTGDTRLIDYQGELLINEAVEYMKYAKMGDGIEQLLDKLSILETPEKVSYIYEEKQKAEEQLVAIDKGILKLMNLLDGIKTSKKGIEVTKSGQLKTEDYFVKKICLGEVKKETVGINQDNIFLALKSSYFNPTIDFNAIITELTNLEHADKQLAEIAADKIKIETNISNEQIKLDNLNKKAKKSKEDKIQIKAITNTIKALVNNITEYDAKTEEQEKSKLSSVAKITASKESILKLTSAIKPVINDAVRTLDTILLKTEIATPVINQYEKFLSGQEEMIEKEVYAGLEENLNTMKKYIAVDESGYDFAGMKLILENDLYTLNQVEELIIQGNNELTQALYQNSKISFEEAVKRMQDYQINGLTLDYSTLVLDQSAQENPLSQVNNLLQSGIISLVMDPGKLSDKTLTQEMLPSEIAALSDEDTDFFAKLSSFFKASSIGENNSGMGDLFHSFGDKSQILSIAGDGINNIAEHFLYQEYLKDHFERYTAEKGTTEKGTTEKDATVRKPSALDYEQEYLLVGKSTDKENLSSVISRIVFLRTIIDFVIILRDSAKRNEAKAVATALVGFTGLPFLISITQALILICWSFSEALLDVCTLMIGKEVPILKDKVVLELPDLFMINRDFLHAKAETLTDTKGKCLSYQDYLSLFLLLKNKKDLAYRSMDLMQEDIKVRYDQDISLYNCFYGLSAKADYIIAPKFLGISYVKRYLNINPGGFHFTSYAAYSY